MKNVIFTIILIFFETAITIKVAVAATTVTSCNRQVDFDTVPEKAVSYDVNLTEMMFALGLQDKMVGYSGISGWQKLSDEFLAAAGDVPQLSEKEPSLEALLAAETDLFFAGWNYGMRAGGTLTPSTLKAFGIKVYELTESCIHIMKKKPASFDDVYNDLYNLGKIFAVEERAQDLIAGYKKTIAELHTKMQTQKDISVFVYDSGKDSPFTAAAYAIPTAMIKVAGGRNIVDDITSSWTRTSWETVVERNPELIIIVDYGQETAEDKIRFLKNHPALANVNAIINQRFFVLSYDEATPGIRNFYASQRLAEALHPDLYSQINPLERL